MKLLLGIEPRTCKEGLRGGGDAVSNKQAFPGTKVICTKLRRTKLSTTRANFSWRVKTQLQESSDSLQGVVFSPVVTLNARPAKMSTPKVKQTTDVDSLANLHPVEDSQTEKDRVTRMRDLLYTSWAASRPSSPTSPSGLSDTLLSCVPVPNALVVTLRVFFDFPALLVGTWSSARLSPFLLLCRALGMAGQARMQYPIYDPALIAWLPLARVQNLSTCLLVPYLLCRS